MPCSPIRNFAEQFLGSTPKTSFLTISRMAETYGVACSIRDGFTWKATNEGGRKPDVDRRRLLCFYDAEGRITGHFGIQRDISERQKAEEALSRFNQRVKLLQQMDRAILSASPSKTLPMRHWIMFTSWSLAAAPAWWCSTSCWLRPRCGSSRLWGYQAEIGSEISPGVFGIIDQFAGRNGSHCP